MAGAYISTATDTGYLRIRFTFAGQPVAVMLGQKESDFNTKEKKKGLESRLRDIDRWVQTDDLTALCAAYPKCKPLAKIRMERQFGRLNGGPSPTIAEFKVQWFGSILGGAKLSTLAAYDSIYENWIASCPVRNSEGKVVGRLVDRRLNELTTSDGDSFKTFLLGPDGPKTDAMRRKAFFELRRIFQAARERAEVTGMTNDPLVQIKKKHFNLDTAAQRKDRKTALSAWTDREVERLIDVAYALDPQWGAITEVAFFTGLRRGELLGLKWDDIDFERELIDLNWSLRPSPVREGSRLAEQMREFRGEAAIEPGYQFISTLKTDGSSDTVEMVPRVVQALREQRQRVQLRSKEGWVFQTAEGGSLCLNAFARDAWREIVEKAGVTLRAFEQTRHTFIQLALNYGGTGEGNLEWLKGMVRHTSYNMIINHYAKHTRKAGRPDYVAGGKQRPAARKLWAKFGARLEKSVLKSVLFENEASKMGPENGEKAL